MKLLDTFPLSGKSCIKIYLKSETNEYVLRRYNYSGKWYKPADYVTDDKQHALDIARCVSDNWSKI